MTVVEPRDRSYVVAVTDGARRRGQVEEVAFDVALTVSEGAESGVRVGVFTGIFGGGGKLDENTLEQRVSRVRFQVKVGFPVDDKPPGFRRAEACVSFATPSAAPF